MIQPIPAMYQDNTEGACCRQRTWPRAHGTVGPARSWTMIAGPTHLSSEYRHGPAFAARAP
eukprot:scaffold4280_cov385-Prasinococcus_capsulatus_cf.AAC.5